MGKANVKKKGAPYNKIKKIHQTHKFALLESHKYKRWRPLLESNERNGLYMVSSSQVLEKEPSKECFKIQKNVSANHSGKSAI
jgi:hypothetical protein